MMQTPIPSVPSADFANPKPRDEDLDFFGITDKGKVRHDNQDHFLVTTLHKTMRVHVTSLPNPELLELPSQRIASVAMVCDGVGGHAGGEAASRSAVEAIASYVTHTMQCFFSTVRHDERPLLESLQQAAKESHELIAARARESGDRKGMATTLTMFVAVWPALYLLQVGDSRCYRFRQGAVERLTRDQTMAEDLRASGVLSEEQAARSPYANVLSSSLGGASWTPEVSRADLRQGDVLLLCTDGLTKHVSDEQIRRRLDELVSSEQVARALLQDALDAGGTDNVTVLVLRAVVRE
ncbi:MAG TPA: protein phosphatase 2C domain-containing protein [Gemmatimonadales bacterium]|jgi:protein phosphatase|nr:protein phosphatase 2C domain-containing protein [Gemmatimonadales bacterium]